MNYEKNDPKRLDALVKHLNEDAASDEDKVTADAFTRAGAENCWKLGDNCGESWYVLTYDEARELAKEKIKDSVWAFNADFVVSHIKTEDCGLLSDWECGHLEQHIKRMCEDMCESANSIILLLLRDNFDSFAEDALDADGIGHFLSSWDDKEIELGSGLYAYCE